MTVAERRRFNRIQNILPLSYRDNNDFPFNAILDYSAGGLRLKCAKTHTISVGASYEITFSPHPASLPIRATARIVWVATSPNNDVITAGAEFTQISQENKSTLNYLTCKDRLTQLNLSHSFCFYFTNLLRKNSLRSPVASVRHMTLPKNIQDLLEPYRNLSFRNDFFYCCCLRTMEQTTLPCVPIELRTQLLPVKFLGFLFSVLIDDLLDEKKEYALLEAVLKMPFSNHQDAPLHLPHPSQDHFNSLKTLWNSFFSQLQKAPLFTPFEKLLRYDYEQFLNSIKYSLLLHQMPHANNTYEAQTIHPHSIHISILSTIDLMFSPQFEMSNLGLLRHITQVAQYLSHINNWVISWRRELAIDDFTSGVFAYALEQKLITPEELLDKTKHPAIIEKIEHSDYKEYFFLLLDVCRQELELIKNKMPALDLTQYIKGIENLFLMQTTYNL